MKQITIIMIFALITVTLFATDPIGQWTFDNLTNLLEATYGNDLVLEGTHTATAGTDAGDGAVNIGVGSYYHCFHDIAANGTGTWVNQYSIVIDFKVPSIGDWYAFHQTSVANSNDGDSFINTSGHLGVAATGYSSYQIIPNEWYRLVIASDLGNTYKYYLDGELLQDGGAQTLDGRFSIYPSSAENELLFFADNDSEDNPIDVSAVSLYDVCLTNTEIGNMGGFGHQFESPGLLEMHPFLQGPTPTSMYVSWHEASSNESTVEYGTTDALGSAAVGDVHTFNSETVWHSVKLENLQPDTEYFYQCITGTEQSDIFNFRTSPAIGDRNGHFVFAIVGDNQAEPAMVTTVMTSMRDKFIELYGDDWHNEVDLLLDVGDTVTIGSNLAEYNERWFKPFRSITPYIPTMVSIGNHEGESQNFYNYVKNEDFVTGTEGEKYYEFELGPVKFASLNSITAGDTQVNWYQDVVTATDNDPNYDWLFTFKHYPGRSELWPYGNSDWVWNQINPIANQTEKSTMLFAGHSHNYQRGAMSEGTSRLIISGASGAHLDRWGMYSNQTDYFEMTKSLDNYVYVIVDIDLENGSYAANTYSLGHNDLLLDTVLMDSWHGVLSQDPPETPEILQIGKTATSPLTVTASPFTSPDEIMSSRFQIANINDDFNNPVVDEYWNWENYYWDTGAPDYLPVDQNAGIDLERITGAFNLTQGETYLARVQYRDQNLKWSEWSTPVSYIYTSEAPEANFVLDNDTIEEGESIRFTDISIGSVTSWEWDVGPDGTVDSYEQDPEMTFTQSGVFGLELSVVIEGITYTASDFSAITVLPSTGIEENSSPIASGSISSYPNPFNTNNSDSMTFDITLPKQSTDSRLDIYNIRGQLVNSFNLNRGFTANRTVKWDGNSNKGEKVSSGIYFATLKENGEVITSKKMLLLK